MPTKPREDEEVVELLTWDPDVDGDEEEEEFEDELPADEAMFSEETGELVEEGDDYAAKKKAELPQPDRARSHPDLPKVKSNAFKRILS
ncbi:MAG: hypothetical protein ACO1OB_11595 [Archangium sp.]